MAKSIKNLKMGHVQDTPVSTSMISNVRTYDMSYESAHSKL